MSDGHEIRITIGDLLLLGLLTDARKRRSPTRVMLLLALGSLMRRRSIVGHVGCGLIRPDLVVSL